MDQGDAAVWAGAIAGATGVGGALVGALVTARSLRRQIRDQEGVDQRKNLWQERRDAYFALLEAHGLFVDAWATLDGELGYERTDLSLLESVHTAAAAVVRCRARIPLVGPRTLTDSAQGLSDAVGDVNTGMTDWYNLVNSGIPPAPGLRSQIEQIVLRARAESHTFRDAAQGVLFPE
ncbi:hypothetical protein [Streptomyces sp. NPDC058697]|uniref:hypothetical protein n=1 Tax=Streptomyces sp. NPDC058697 TaxID=3346605 RepID=UPI0036633DDD